MVLLAPPVTKATEEIIGEEAIDRVPDYVDIHRLVYPEPDRQKALGKTKKAMYISANKC